ncbi:hypothetical protein LUZ60_003589 [Juncus effusus]|nr:hypothetical protein LUZ60_003589 [Juncus effusus]
MNYDYRVLPRQTENGKNIQEEQLLPIANVGKIMKLSLPSHAKISKSAKEIMQECASEFIGFVTGEAADKCHKEKRKTINGEDICNALEVLGLDNYAEAMKRYLQRYRECQEIEMSAKMNKSVELSLFGGDFHGKDSTDVPTTSRFL